tara:strand:+ start:515 stop:1030 length:516 start_codon:yes stop_codon:yes gene_type:complete
MVQRALGDLFQAHRKSLVWLVNRIVGCTHTAEDLAQEAYVKVATATAKGEVGALQPFLYRTARNLALDHLRQRRVRRELDDEDGRTMDSIASAEPSPEAVVRDREMLDRLSRAMAGLSTRRREILVLHKIHGWTYRRIAHELGISESAVQQNVSVALLHCVEAMAEEESET